MSRLDTSLDISSSLTWLDDNLESRFVECVFRMCWMYCTRERERGRDYRCLQTFVSDRRLVIATFSGSDGLSRSLNFVFGWFDDLLPVHFCNKI